MSGRNRIPELIDTVVRLAAEKGVPIDPEASPVSRLVLDAYADYFPEPMPEQFVEFYRHWPFEDARRSTSGSVSIFRESLGVWNPRAVMAVPFNPRQRVNENSVFEYTVEVGLVPGDLFAFPWLSVDHASGTVHRDGSVWFWDMSGDGWCPLRVAGSIEEFLADEVEVWLDPGVRWDPKYLGVSGRDGRMLRFNSWPPTNEAEVLALLRDEEQ